VENAELRGGWITADHPGLGFSFEALRGGVHEGAMGFIERECPWQRFEGWSGSEIDIEFFLGGIQESGCA